MKKRELYDVPCDESKIQRTIEISKAAFVCGEWERPMSRLEFLCRQSRYIKKRWWLLQAALLMALWAVLLLADEDRYIQRSMGVMASLFGIFIIPELWKNRSCGCMEIEAASYYSLRQIYAARMLLFGMVDILLVSLFCGTAAMGLHYELTRLMVQFLFPLSVTACICFGTLCSRYVVSEAMAIALCVVWSAVWMLLVLNEHVYGIITFPIWLCLLGLTVAYLSFLICRTLKNCNGYWEVSYDGAAM